MKKFLSLVLALVMTMSLVTISAGAKDFTDGDDIQYTEAVDVISAIEVVDGYTDGSFNPDATLTRGAAAKIICNLLLGPTTASALSADAAPFSDVPTTNTFAGYIAYCSQQGIISGYADGTFRPAGTLTSYAFMKMLLGALGYDAEREGYVGANWSVQVAKTALGIGLDDGLVDDFNGLKAVTREEACLYAFNTLSANMVRYGETTNVVIGDAQVSVTGERRWDDDEGAGKDNIVDDEIVQFAERYFTKLVLNDDVDDVTDSFGRPSNTWTYKNDKIGTYAKTADATYTKNTAEADIYDDIGMTSNDWFTVYVDGIIANDYDSVKYASKAGEIANVQDDNGDVIETRIKLNKGEEDDKIGQGNGAIVEVYKEDRVIAITNTYVGEVITVEEATSKRDAYVEIGMLGDTDVYTLNVLNNEKFDTEAFEVGDIVTFTYSIADNAVKSVKATDSVTGDVESFTTNKKFSMDGTTYEYGAKAVNYYGSSDIGTQSTVYMDANGYVLYAKEGEDNLKNYALVLNAGIKTSLSSNNDAQAYLLFTDGTTKTVDTDKNYGAGDPAGGNYGTGKIGQWVTYKINSDGEYVLTTPKGVQDYSSDASSAVETENGKTAITLSSGDMKYVGTPVGGNATAEKINSATVIIVKDANDKFKVYEGVKAIPSISDGNDNAGTVAEFAAFSSTANGFLKLLYIDVSSGDAVVETGSDKTIFLVGKRNPDEVTTSSEHYYVFDAVVDGVLVEGGAMLDADDFTGTWGDNGTSQVIKHLLTGPANSILLDSYSVDDGVYTVKMSDKVVAGVNGDGDTVTGGRVEKVSGNCIDFGSGAYYTADDCVFYRVDDNGNLKKVTISSFRTDYVGAGEYYTSVSYVYNNDAELTGVYWVYNTNR